ncbi:NUDIX domain-containing protein [Halorarum salinum]|uniref:NUDIX domain-containing protein n=1 Tax=Halorarum salinum TaxID=2743089 RepID=A0A7D5QF71_9EURY|nr:NUDIX domain-containing protein [Halobaculum salinum]QLG61203.1 NUDIX domain-containing protein [Halobaculum salinum]
MNQPPEHCPYCGTAVTGVDTPTHAVVETPTVYRCESCDDYVFYNPTPGGSAAVVDGGRLLLVEDFRSPGEWKLPSGRMALGESPREGVARELEEETGLSVDPDDLAYFYDEAGEPVEGQYMVGIDYAVPRSKTAGTLEAGSDATDARFFTPAEFADSPFSIKGTHVDRFGTDSLDWLLCEAERALDAERETG